MSIVIFDPVADVEVPQRADERVLDTLSGKAVGYIFNQHVSALAFWKHLEANVETALEPSRTVRVYKANTWAPALAPDVDRVLEETAYALVGVGA